MRPAVLVEPDTSAGVLGTTADASSTTGFLPAGGGTESPLWQFGSHRYLPAEHRLVRASARRPGRRGSCCDQGKRYLLGGQPPYGAAADRAPRRAVYRLSRLHCDRVITGNPTGPLRASQAP